MRKMIPAPTNQIPIICKTSRFGDNLVIALRPIGLSPPTVEKDAPQASTRNPTPCRANPFANLTMKDGLTLCSHEMGMVNDRTQSALGPAGDARGMEDRGKARFAEAGFRLT